MTTRHIPGSGQGAPPAPVERLAGLDGIRALACLAVFAEHWQQKARFAGTWGPFDTAQWLVSGWGVAVLFILSGFLLSLPFWQALAAGGAPPPLRRFWARRLARLLPAYYVCLGVLVVHNRVWEEPHGPIDILLHASLLFNFAEFSFYSINPPFWALGIIAQFYLVFPAILALARPLGARGAPWAIALVAVAAYAAHAALLGLAANTSPWPLPAHLVRPDGYVLSRSLLAHLPHFLLGTLAGAWWQRLRGRATRPSAVAEVAFWGSAVAATAILGTPLAEGLSLPEGRYSLPLVPLFLTALVLAAPRAAVASRLLESPPVRLTGTLSYGIYIYHYPALNLSARALERAGLAAAEHWLLLGGLALAATYLVAALSYALVERPLLRRTGRPRAP